MSGTDEYKKTYVHITDAPTEVEYLTTLRTLQYFARKVAKKNGRIHPYLYECIRYIEYMSPDSIKNIINLMYN